MCVAVEEIIEQAVEKAAYNTVLQMENYTSNLVVVEVHAILEKLQASYASQSNTFQASPNPTN